MASGLDRALIKETKKLQRNISHQLARLKQAVPKKVWCLLYQQEVDAVEHALEILTELYQPLKDSSTLMEEILTISQQLNERLRQHLQSVLAGWIEDAAHKYSEMLQEPSMDLDKLIKSRFKHAIVDQETRNQLL